MAELREATLEAAHELRQTDVTSGADLPEFEDIQTSLSRLVSAYEWLVLTEATAKLFLIETSVLANLNQEVQKNRFRLRIRSFRHSLRGTDSDFLRSMLSCAWRYTKSVYHKELRYLIIRAIRGNRLRGIRPEALPPRVSLWM